MKIAKTIKLFGILSLVCLVTLSMISAAAANPTVCRELPISANPGDTITVELNMELDGADKTVIEDNVPAGWVVSNPSDGGFIVGTDTVTWANTGAAPGDNQLTYDVTIPGDAAGTYAFDGVFDLAVAAPGLQAITCETQMDVVEEPVPGPGPGPGPADDLNVCRDLPTSANPGDTITVILDLTLVGADKTVIEDNVPAGWVVSNPSDGGAVEDTNTVNWIFINSAPSDNQLTYDVTIPGDAAGTYNFDGEFDLAVAAPGLQTIDCDTQMNVEEAGPGPVDDLNVCRDLPTSANPGDTITVLLDLTLVGADKTVIEDNVPAGWLVSNPSDGGSIEDTNTVNWIFINSAPGVTQLTYDVTIPGDAAVGPYTFGGEFDLAVAAPGLQTITCDTQMNVVEVPEEPECPVADYDPIVIEPCWNFMSVPFALNNSSVEFVLADINYNNLLYWNTSGAIWEIPTEFEPLKAYWIESNESVDQLISSEILEPLTPAVPPTMTVYPGWNAIGYTDSMAILPAELMLGSIDESYMVVIGPYDSANGMYEQIGHNGETGVISGIHVGTDIFDMGPYEGFWVYVTQEDTIAGF
ncbi:hypothetical protein [Methanococcoides alaskense]|nr:hypothetical protein [Methanococcoides alaskense]MDA0524505.1 hypothetical protein [Methanococcoides alaskense]